MRAYASLVILTLAIGIGPTTAIFSVVHALLIRDLPYRDAESLVVLWRYRNATDHAPVSGPDYADFREMNTTLSDMAAATRADNFNLGGVAQPIRVEGSRVTPNFFQLLGTRPLLGAWPVDERSVAISHDLWKLSFGGANVVGRETRLNGETYVIAAVMPRDLGYPERAQLWIPYALTSDRLGHRAYHRLNVIGRLKPHVTLAQADADMKRIAKGLGELYPDTTRGIGASVSSLRDTLAGPVRKPLLILFGAVVFLLLIACSNVANLALTRAAARRRELFIRRAVGATTTRIAGLLLTESVALSVIGGIGGLALAALTIRVLRAIGGPYFARPELITLDGSVLAFNFAVAVLTGIAFGLAALASHEKHDRRVVREAIVVSIIAFSFFLLVGAGLMVRGFLKLRAIDVGVRTAGTMTLRVYLPESKYPDIPARSAFYEQFVKRLREVSGVDSAASVSGLPLENTMSGDIVFTGEADPVAARRIASFTEVSPGYFRAAGVRLIEGRDFTWDDIHHLPQLARAPVLVNETYWRRFHQREVLVGGDMPATVIGVVSDVKQTDARADTPPHIYMPLGAPLPPRAMNFILRSESLAPAAMRAIATDVLHRLDGDVPPYRIRTMEEVIADAYAGARFQAILLTAFAAIALLLATIGIYGVISYTVARRTREVAIRMAIGAGASDVVRLVLLRVLALAALGLAAGATGAIVLASSIDIGPADPALFASVGGLTIVVAMIASAAPARRAASLDPMRALRAE